MTYLPREANEPLAMHLHRNAEMLGADRRQRAVLNEAARLAYGTREQRVTAGRMAWEIGNELKDTIAAVTFAAQARGERVVEFNDQHALRVKGRDGLWLLVESGALNEAQANTGVQYRALFEEVGSSALGSQLGRVGEVRSHQDGNAAQVGCGLYRAFAGVKLSDAETAVGSRGRIAVLRAVVGEGRTIRSLATGSRKRAEMALHLAEDLDKVRVSLATPRDLRIRGQ